VKSYPNFVVTDAGGVTLSRWAGYLKPMFIERTSETLGDPTTIDQKRARYAAKPTAGDAGTLGRYYDARSEYADALPYYKAAQKMNRDPDVDYLMPIFETTFYGLRKDMFTFQELVAHAEALFASDKTQGDDLVLAARMLLSASRDADAVDAAVPYVAKAVERTEGATDPDIQESRVRIMPDYDLLVLKDSKKAVADKKAAMPEGWDDDPDGINSFAWWCFENQLDLEEAQTLAEKGVQLSEPGGARAMILDTLAEICNARGDCGQAVELTRQAIQDDPDKEYYQKQLERFQGLLAEKKNHKE
jgi:tetratricopeptide (TPR) repeat protein